MLSFILRKLLASIPVYLGIVLIVMLCLRVNDPVQAYLGKSASPESIAAQREKMGLDEPFVSQYVSFIGRIVTLNFSEESWERKQPVGEILASAVVPSLAITVPALLLTTI
ncbi:MAG: ABC transporter permease, partial [Phycisphaerales bacterium]